MNHEPYQHLPAFPPEPIRPPHAPGFGAEVGVRCGSEDVVPLHHLERIEELDDAIFAALNGDPEALDRSASLYRAASRHTPAELLDESRRQYIRRAESIVEDSQHTPGRSLGRTFAALEILTLMAE